MSTLEERALADSDDSDRFTSGYGDAIDSFVAQTRALVAVTAERDAALAEVENQKGRVVRRTRACQKAADQRDQALATIGRVKAVLSLAGGNIQGLVTIDDIRAALEPTDLPKGTKP